VRRMDTGLPKLWLIHKALMLRRDHPEWFGADARYEPIIADGAKSMHLVAFQRAARVAVFVPRWPMRLAGSWGSTTVELPSGQWSNILTGETFAGARIRVQTLLRRFPVALLVKESQ
jgi:(1->4)-alpha-D-glucan 1-alpha-D-glucosylmutase